MDNETCKHLFFLHTFLYLSKQQKRHPELREKEFSYLKILKTLQIGKILIGIARTTQKLNPMLFKNIFQNHC